MDTGFRSQVLHHIADIEAKETYDVHAPIPIGNEYTAQGVFHFMEKRRNENVSFSLNLKPAIDKSEWMMRPLKKEESIVGLIAQKVLTPGYNGYFQVSEPGNRICPIGQLSGMRALGFYPPGYQAILDDALETEERYINAYLPQRGEIVGRDAIEKKVTVVADTILRIVSALHGKPHAEREVFFSGCFLDNPIAYLRPRVEKADASFSWVVKFGAAIPASDLASPSKEIQMAQEALAHYEKSIDAEYQAVVVSSLKAVLANANGIDLGAQDPFVRPVQSIELVGLLHPSVFIPNKSKEELEEVSLTPFQSEIDWAILVKIFERINRIWVERCKNLVVN